MLSKAHSVNFGIPLTRDKKNYTSTRLALRAGMLDFNN
ncbi:hypothetical protein FM107_07005 [Sphingobacterium sp. JB170]|nr:hypothetical protein FM107_07005 [Sphingobacterium sp. JB170]